MKRSLSHLPREKQDDIKRIARYVSETLSQCEMIILYGSYARGDYVDYDQRIEYGVPTYFMSDYDILVLTATHMNSKSFNTILGKVKKRYYAEKGNTNRPFITSIEFIHESVDAFNKAIRYGHYFYTDIKKEGILLFDSKRQKLARRRKPNFVQIIDIARKYFEEKFNRANSFLRDAKYAHSCGDHIQASFYLHQSCEHLYRAIILSFTLYSDKTHNLEDLSGMAKAHSLEIAKAFPRGTEREQYIFKLLNEAYIQARYNSEFVVTKEDIEAALPQVELLREITQEVCEAKIAEYSSMTIR